MPACGQAVGCGVCDTPELWCGAAGLCARVRACAGAAESLHTYRSENTQSAGPADTGPIRTATGNTGRVVQERDANYGLPISSCSPAASYMSPLRHRPVFARIPAPCDWHPKDQLVRTHRRIHQP